MGEDDLGFLETALAKYPEFIPSKGEDFPEPDPADDDTALGVWFYHTPAYFRSVHICPCPPIWDQCPQPQDLFRLLTH